MERIALIRMAAAALGVVAACGGPVFTTGGGDDGGASDDAGLDVTVPEGGNADGPAGHDGGKPEGGELDALPVPDVLEEPPPTCSGAYACVAGVPGAPGFGPYEVYSGTGPLPACTALFQSPEDGNDQLDAGAPTCGCQCGAPSVTCAPFPMSFFNVAGCGATTNCATTSLTPSTCTPLDVRSACGATSTLSYMTAVQATVAGATCTPLPSQNVPPATWSLTGRACISSVAPSQVDCPSGSICAPKPAPPFAAATCIATTGDIACPQAGYVNKHVFYTSLEDTRGCSPCTCGGAASPTCSATVDAYQLKTSCSGTATTYVAPFTCQGVDQPSAFEVTMTTDAGACPPSQSTPTGAAAPSQPITICCTQ
jgi:hypothetical protein